MPAPAGNQAKEKLTAKSVEPGKYDLVLSPEHMWLTIHESVGHPTELDRVLGYEANFAGTSFATLDKWQTKKFKYGAELVNIVADKVNPRFAGRGRLRRRRRQVQALGHHQGRHPGQLPGHARPGPHHRREGIARLLVRGQLEQRAVPAHAQRLARGRQGQAHAGRDDQGRQEGDLHRRRRLVLDRPAALQLPVRRPAVLRDQERQDRRSCSKTWLTSPTPRNSGTPAAPSATRATGAWAAPSSTAKASRASVGRVARLVSTTRFNGINVINTARKIG